MAHLSTDRRLVLNLIEGETTIDGLIEDLTKAKAWGLAGTTPLTQLLDDGKPIHLAGVDALFQEKLGEET